jgi:hypothetical protein
MISADQRQQFTEQGYVVAQGLLDVGACGDAISSKVLSAWQPLGRSRHAPNSGRCPVMHGDLEKSGSWLRCV